MSLLLTFPLFFFFFFPLYQHQKQKNTGNTGKMDSIRLPPISVKTAAQQQVKKLSKCSSASSLRLDSQHSWQDGQGFDKLLKLPASEICLEELLNHILIKKKHFTLFDICLNRIYLSSGATSNLKQVFLTYFSLILVQ